MHNITKDGNTLIFYYKSSIFAQNETSCILLLYTITEHQKEARDHSLQGGLVKKLNVRYELFKCKNHR